MPYHIYFSLEKAPSSKAGLTFLASEPLCRHTNAWLILIELASSCLLHHGSCVTADLIFEVWHMSEPAGKLFGEQRLRSEWHSCPGLKRTA